MTPTRFLVRFGLTAVMSVGIFSGTIPWGPHWFMAVTGVVILAVCWRASRYD